MANIDFEGFKPKVVTVGVGGQGSNLVNRLYNSGIKNADTIAINTDAAHLNMIKVHKKILIGKQINRGLGSGGFPEVAAKSAETSIKEIEAALQGYDLVFVSAGMGGGTGTGASPIVAKVAKEQGATVIGVVTYPFALERSRKGKADWGIEQLGKYADTTIIIENDRLLSYASNMQMQQAFALVDNVTGNAIKSISDAITQPSMINLDYADLKSIVKNTGTAVINIGYGNGPDRIARAIKSTRTHPLLNVDYKGAKGALLHIAGGANLTISDVTKLGEGITEELGESANVIFGARVVPEFTDQIRVMSVITGVTPKIGQKSATAEEHVEALELKGLDRIY